MRYSLNRRIKKKPRSRRCHRQRGLLCPDNVLGSGLVGLGDNMNDLGVSTSFRVGGRPD